MNTLAVFGIFSLIAGAKASQGSQFNPVCGEKLGFTSTDLGNLDVFGNWSDKDKCYFECVFEAAGAWENGRFNDAFKAGVAKGVAEDADNFDKQTMELCTACLEQVHSTGCEGAYEFVKCIVATELGAGLIFFGSLAGLVGGVAQRQ